MLLTRRQVLQSGFAAAGAAALTHLPATAEEPMYVVIESQDWWTPIPGIDDPTLGHLHMAVTLPTDEVSGIVPVHVRVTAHDNRAHLNLLKFQDDKGRAEQVHRMDFDLANDEPLDFVYPIDTRTMSSGWRIFRFYAQAQHAGGNLQVARPTLPVYVNSDQPRDDASAAAQYRPTSWYKEPDLDWGYALAAVARADLPIDAPVPPEWAPLIQFNRNAKGDSPPITRWDVRIDPRFHDGIPGRILREGTAPWKGRVTVPIGELEPGTHRLVLKGTQVKGEKEHSVVAVFPFTVA